MVGTGVNRSGRGKGDGGGGSGGGRGWAGGLKEGGGKTEDSRAGETVYGTTYRN